MIVILFVILIMLMMIYGHIIFYLLTENTFGLLRVLHDLIA